MMNRKMLWVVSLVSLVLVSGLTAFAQVPPAPIMTSDTVGANGFPTFIVDSAGLQLGLCDVDNGVDALGEALGPCVLEPGVTNYWAADTIVEDEAAGTRYLASMSIAAIVEPGIRQIGNEIVVRLRNKNGLAPGNYTVVTPYKTYTLTAVAGDRDIRVVDGVETIISGAEAVPFPPAIAIDGPVRGNLLTTLNDPANPPPAGFVGTGAEVILSPIDVAGPNGGEFIVTGPGGELARTNLFSVQGRLAAGATGAITTDTVTIRSVRFNARRRTVTVAVASSVRGSTFTATESTGAGVVTVRRGNITVSGLTPGFHTINVSSSGGGTAAVSVTIP
jgi:hypothetical protein